MNALRILICAVLVCGVVTFSITNEFFFPPNEYITDIIVHNNYAYAFLGLSNPATHYKINLDSMKVELQYNDGSVMQPGFASLDKSEAALYYLTLNSSAGPNYVDQVLQVDYIGKSMGYIVDLTAITNSVCNQFFSAGPKLYCISQAIDSGFCTIMRIHPTTFTVEASKTQFCTKGAMYESSFLVTPDNQYAYIGFNEGPYIVSLADLVAYPMPAPQIKPYVDQKISLANHAMCATPDVTMIYRSGTFSNSFVRTNVTSNIGTATYYVEHGIGVTCCLVSPDSRYVFTGLSDGSVRRADALAPNFGSGKTTLYTLDSAIIGIRMLDDQQTVLVWTATQMLKFKYNDELQPISPQKLALQENFRTVSCLTVDREEEFAYLFAYDTPNDYTLFTYLIKYDLEQEAIVQVANTTDLIQVFQLPATCEIFLNADETRVAVFSGSPFVFDVDEFSLVYANPKVQIAFDVDSFQDPITSQIVFTQTSDTQTMDQVVSYNIDTKEPIQCSVSRPQNQQFKHLIRGPNNKVMVITPAADNVPTLAIVDRTTCATKYLNYTLSPMILKGGGAYFAGSYYLTARDVSQNQFLVKYDPLKGMFSQVANLPSYDEVSTQVSFGARDAYIMAPELSSDAQLYKLDLVNYNMESLQLYAQPIASYYHPKLNNAYVLTATNPPSIVKIKVFD